MADERYLHIVGYGDYTLTENDVERLEAGRSITINVFKPDSVPRHSARDLYAPSLGRGYAHTPSNAESLTDAAAIKETIEDQREWAKKRYGTERPWMVGGMNPAADPKKASAAMDEVIDRERRYNYPRDLHYTGRTVDINTGFDDISRPAHYAEGRKYEPKDVIRDWGLGFNLGSATKYISRAGKKDSAIVDLEKAKTFIQFEIDALKEEGETE